MPFKILKPTKSGFKIADDFFRFGSGAMTTFPPTEWWHIFEYDDDEIVAGYRDYRPGDPEPGANHSDGYRWGWINGRKDTTHAPDGYEPVRYAYIRNARLLDGRVH